jgi:hypothetical protein
LEAAILLLDFRLGLQAVSELGRGGGHELGAAAADRAPASVVGQLIELNGAEVEGHAGDANHKVARFGQTTSVPQQILRRD